MLHGDGHQEITALDTIASLTLDETLGAAEPPRRVAEVPAYCQVDAQVERAAHGSQRLGVVEMCVMRTFESAQEVVHAADHERRRRQQLEVGGSERQRPISSDERSPCVLPRAARMRRTPSLEGVTGSVERLGMRLTHGA
jgi:hypothetical protein